MSMTVKAVAYNRLLTSYNLLPVNVTKFVNNSNVPGVFIQLTSLTQFSKMMAT